MAETDPFDPSTVEAPLLAKLDELGVDYVRHAHAPVFTVEEARDLRGALPGAHCKNLFLKERKGGFWLAVCEEERRFRIPDLARAVGARRFSFGSAEDLTRLLGVQPGSVTPLALLNDRTREVRLILDPALTKADLFNCHPLHNAATLAMSPGGLKRVLRETGHEPIEIDFDALEALAAD